MNFDSLAGPEENPFSTTPLTGTLHRAGETGLSPDVFLCGNANGDGITNIADVICKINYIFLGVPTPCPPEVVDHNGDGAVNVADIVAEINYLFLGVPLECPLL